jgi:hypothetical protein
LSNSRGGFGSTMPGETMCFMFALHLNRTMTLDSKGWSYDARGLDAYFEPSSDCTKDDVTENVVVWKGSIKNCPSIYEHKTKMYPHFKDNLPKVRHTLKMPITNGRNLLFNAEIPINRLIPKIYKQEVAKFHSDPFGCYVGQIVSYLLRINDAFLRNIQSKKFNSGVVKNLDGSKFISLEAFCVYFFQEFILEEATN